VNDDVDPNNPLLLRQINDVKEYFSKLLENSLTQANWVPNDGRSELVLGISYTYFGVCRQTELKSLPGKVKDVVIEELFGKPDKDGNYHPIPPCQSSEMKISIDIQPKNVKPTQISDPRIKLACKIKPGENGFFIDNKEFIGIL
jgi:hypothetical protein